MDPAPRRRRAGAAGADGQIVAVVGEPGVGKSRLFYEFIRSHRVHDWLVLESSSVSYGKATAYLPLVDLLKGYFKIADGDDTRAIRSKVTGAMLTLDEALKDFVPPLLWLLDALPDGRRLRAISIPPQRRRRTLEAIRRLLLRESRVQPLLRGLRGPALDRRRDAGLPRQPRREPADRGHPARRQLPAGVPARMGAQDLLPPAPDRSAAARERRRPAHDPARRGPERRAAAAACSSSAPRAIRSSSKRACGRWSRPAPSSGSAATTVWRRRRRPSRFRRPCRRSSRRASIDFRRSTSGCSRRPRWSARTCRSRCCARSPASTTTRCAPGSPSSRPRSSSTRPRCSRISSTRSSTR